MKTYAGDFARFKKMLKDREPFALSRFGDGELKILMRTAIRLREFDYDPNDPTDQAPRERLLSSFHHKGCRYYVGISCPNCVGEEKFAWAKLNSRQDEDHLTWAALFVNSNYSRYLAEIVPLFSRYEVILVCNRSAVLKDLPFPVLRDFRVERNAWKNNRNLVERISDYIERKTLKGKLFLFCAGPFSCILAHRLHCQFEANTYLDVGSTLDPFFFGVSAGTRGYLRGDETFVRRTCVWKYRIM